MRKLIVPLLALFILSGCSSMNFLSQQPEIYTTNNGSMLFLKQDSVNQLCTKDSLDTLLVDHDPDAIKNEFSFKDYDELMKNLNASQTLTSYPEKCNYSVKYSDYTNTNDWVTLEELDLKKDQSISVSDMIKKSEFKEFIDQNNIKVNDIVVAKILSQEEKNDSTTLLSNADSLTAKENGKYQLVAYPVFRFYHFLDKKKVYDYNFSAIVGLKFDLKKIDN